MKTVSNGAQIGANLSTQLTGQGTLGPTSGPDSGLNKWAILSTIEACREGLGLKATSISLLRAMITFIKGDQLQAHRQDGHICFASNAALAARTYVSIQTVERHISRLIALGLVRRHTSGNGKRWARRDRAGRITLVSGLSLAPLAERLDEFEEMAETVEQEHEQIQTLRDKCRIALGKLTELAGGKLATSEITHTTQRLLRRKSTATELSDLHAQILVEIQGINKSDASKMRGNDTQIEGQKETNLNQVVEKSEQELSPKLMEQAFPKLCREMATARTARDCQTILSNISGQLSLGKTGAYILKQGPELSFMLIGYLLERLETIQNPKAYAQSLINGLGTGRIQKYSLLGNAMKPT